MELLAPEQHFSYRPCRSRHRSSSARSRRFELEPLAADRRERSRSGARPASTSGATRVHVDEHAGRVRHAPRRVWGAAFPAIPGALTFRGPADVELHRQVLEEIAAGDVRRSRSSFPWGSVWSLPAYELALLTAPHLRATSCRASVLVVTPEASRCSSSVNRRTRRCGRCSRSTESRLRRVPYPRSLATEARLGPEGRPRGPRCWLPRLKGAPLDGLPQTVHGLHSVDSHAGCTE